MCPTPGSIWWGINIPFAKHLGKYISLECLRNPKYTKYGEGAITPSSIGRTVYKRRMDRYYWEVQSCMNVCRVVCGYNLFSVGKEDNNLPYGATFGRFLLTIAAQPSTPAASILTLSEQAP